MLQNNCELIEAFETVLTQSAYLFYSDLKRFLRVNRRIKGDLFNGLSQEAKGRQKRGMEF